MLILICGLPATGKSTVTRKLAKALGAETLRTDIVRKKILKSPQYSEQEKETIYRTVLLMADYLIKNDIDVIIDGTFYKDRLRREARDVAKRRDKRFFLIETRCPEDLVVKRLKARQKNIGSPSDADLEVYQKIKGVFEEIKEDHIMVDTGWNMNHDIKKFLEQVRA